MQGPGYCSASSTGSGTAFSWQPVDWTPDREQRGAVSGPAILRCPVRGCPAVAETTVQLRVLVAHARAHLEAEAEMTVLDARAVSLNRVRLGRHHRWPDPETVIRPCDSRPGGISPAPPPLPGTTVPPWERWER